MQQALTTAPIAQRVSLIPVLSDNYVFVLHGASPGPAVVVDPAVAEPVISWLEQRGLELSAILHTHHHHDHIGGTQGLLQRWPKAAVIASGADQARIPLQTRAVQGGDQLELLGRSVAVLAVPGHTAHHIAFYLPPAGDDGGRLFEGTPQQMHASLQALTALPEATKVWCAHEYTAGNLRWAAVQCPGDGAIQERLAVVEALRARNEPTIPSSIGLERATNLFVRAADADTLRKLRGSKDLWKG
jgi:hydroxyacylglutathione hydrolase